MDRRGRKSFDKEGVTNGNFLRGKKDQEEIPDGTQDAPHKKSTT